jgi:Domain of unknown function (DUF4381)
VNSAHPQGANHGSQPGTGDDWTAQLAPDHTPPPVGWWPPAPGWWGVLFVSLMLVALLALWLRKRDALRSRSAHARVRRAALREIQLIEESNADDPTVAQAIENLLRRYAIALFGAQRVAKLTGAAWLQFLGAHGGSVLAGDAGRTLLDAAFANRSVGDRQGWFSGSREFVSQAARNRLIG